MMRRALMLLFALAASAAEPALAERMVVSLSNNRVAVTSSFVGENLVLFGVIEPGPDRAALRSHYDLVVTMTGPPQTVRTRRKERVLGIWVNVDWREFVRVPSYLTILSNRPVEEIANADLRRRLQVGLDYFLLTQRIGPDIADTVRDDPYRVAFVRLQTFYGLYRQSSSAVTFLTPSVFRVAIPLPSNVPTGSYPIDVKLFSGGEMVARTTSNLEVIKTGVEQYLVEASLNHSLIYGAATSMMALLIGWFASVVFRRD
jgi:uncharacterized protein (TIGR02186 family)